MAATTTKLEVKSRSQTGSRAARRMRRSGRVPGVLYGGEGDALCFDVDARELRVALASSGAVLDLSVDGAKPTPVVLKEAQRDPVRGHTVHVGGEMQIGDTIWLEAVVMPEGVTLLDEASETVIATLSPPRLQVEEEEEVEAETELVGEEAEAAEAAEGAEEPSAEGASGEE